jgi:class 3 adenylate cyclase
MVKVESRIHRWSLAGVLAVAAAAAAIAMHSPIQPWDLRLLDARSALARPDPVAAAEDRVVVVGIDEASSRAIAEPMALWHAHIARLLEGLRAAGPAAVALDLVLPDRSYEAIAPGLDSTLLRALVTTRSAYPTVLALTVDEGGQPRRILPAFVAAAGTPPGYALWPTDADGIIRRFDERLGASGEAVPTLAGEIVRAAGKEPRQGFLDYTQGGAMGFVPLMDVLNAVDRRDDGTLRRWFAGKVVLVGVVMPHVDTVRVPRRLAAWGPPPEATPGVLLQAHAVRVLLADRILAPLAPWAVAIIAALAGLVAGAAARPGTGTALAVAVIFALLASSHAAANAGVVVPVVLAAAATIGGWGVRQGAGVIVQLMERRRLRQSFSGYVSPAVLGEIISGRLTPESGGEQRYVCLLFSDIRGYTTRSEGMRPKDLLDFLNGYFDGVVEILHRHGGTVACFMGDGVMAVFGAPQALENPCGDAFRAAREMLANLEGVNARLQGQGLAPIDIGIGLHAGDAVLGHVGGRQRHDYTAIGDVTNVASRLESATKDAGFRIVVSEEVAARLPQGEGLVPLGPLQLKGHTPVVAFGFAPVAEQAATVR